MLALIFKNYIKRNKMPVPFKKRLQRYHKESLDTLFRTLQFKQGVQRFAPQISVNSFEVTLTDADLIGTTPGTAFYFFLC